MSSFSTSSRWYCEMANEYSTMCPSSTQRSSRQPHRRWRLTSSTRSHNRSRYCRDATDVNRTDLGPIGKTQSRPRWSAAKMADVERVEVVLANNDRVTLRGGDMFLK